MELIIVLAFVVVFALGMLMGQRITLDKVKKDADQAGIKFTWRE